MTAHDQRDRRRIRMRLPGLAVTVGCLAGLAWLVAVDVTLVAALAGLRVPTGDAVAGVLIYRLISLWLVLLAGWILFFLIGFRRIGFRRPGQAFMRPGGEHHAQLGPGAPVAPRSRRHDVAHDLHDDPQEVNSDA